jgi:hypothetical protein
VSRQPKPGPGTRPPARRKRSTPIPSAPRPQPKELPEPTAPAVPLVATAAGTGLEAAPAPSRTGATELEPSLRELRSSIANLRAASEALGASAGPGRSFAGGAGADDALLSAVIEEAERASRAVDRLTAILSGPSGMPAESGGTATVSAARLAAEIARRAGAELDLTVHLHGPIDEDLIVAPTFAISILGALGRLRRDFSVSEVELQARRRSDLLSVEIAFAAREPESSRLREQHGLVLAGGLRGEPALGAAARAAGGEAWLSIRRGEATFTLRLLLPLGPEA